MTRLSKTAALLALALALTAPAARAEDGAVDAATQARVEAAMTAQGYEVRKIEAEDGLIEVYAVKDGKTYEIFLDADLNVVKTNEG